MAKYAFVVPPFDGHVNPTLSIGGELLKRGNEVLWIGVDRKLEKKLPSGGKLLFIKHDFDEASIREQKKEWMTRGIESLKILYEKNLLPLNQFMLDGIMHFLNEYRPDVVIYDHQVFAGAVAAAKLNIPYAASVTSQASIKKFSALPKLHEWETEQVVGFQKQNEIPGESRLDDTASLVLVYTSRYLFGQETLPPFYQFIGPVFKNRPENYDFDWKCFEAMTNRPCILVSIGSILEETQCFFQRIIEALKGEDLTVVMVSDPELYREIPDNFIIQKWVPQLQLLPYLQLVICHGGQNTVSETLSFGIPLIILPLMNDQSQITNDVIQTGAGIRMKFSRFKPEDMKIAVHEILQNKVYKENAEKVQASFSEAGGIERAVSLLETLTAN